MNRKIVEALLSPLGAAIAFAANGVETSGCCSIRCSTWC